MKVKLQNFVDECRKTSTEARRLKEMRIMPEYYDGIDKAATLAANKIEQIIDEKRQEENAMLENMFEKQKQEDLERSVSPCLRGFVGAYRKTYSH